MRSHARWRFRIGADAWAVVCFCGTMSVVSTVTASVSGSCFQNGISITEPPVWSLTCMVTSRTTPASQKALSLTHASAT